MELIAERVGDSIALDKYEHLFREGDKGEIRVYLTRQLYQEEIEHLKSSISSQGAIVSVEQDSRILSIKFEKIAAPLLVIGGAVATLSIGILGWQLWKTSPASMMWGWAIGIVFLGYFLLRRKHVSKR